MLHVERLTGRDPIEALARDWEQLEENLRPRTPFTTHLWNQLWWEHFAARGTWVRDELFILAVRNEFDALIAVAPMMITSRPSFGPLRLRALQPFGADENVTELRGVVCRQGYEAESLVALSQFLRGAADQWDWIQWCGVPAEGPARTLLGRSGSLHWGRTIPNYYLPLPPSWKELKSRLSRNMKEALRKCYNSLKRGGHEFTFKVVTDPAEIRPALETFYSLHAARSRAAHLPPHPDIFARQVTRDFLTDFAQRMATRGQLRIFQLDIGGEVIATRIGFVLGTDLYLYYSGYRTEWAQHSVMTTVVAESIRWAIEQGLTGVDLSSGTDPSKTRWRPVEILSCEGVQSSPRPLRQIAAGAYRQVAQHATPNTVLGWLLSSARRSRL
jgi:CelD/BcsL family acetyltransferase involved in cellulose biosynthesis